MQQLSFKMATKHALEIQGVRKRLYHSQHPPPPPQLSPIMGGGGAEYIFFEKGTIFFRRSCMFIWRTEKITLAYAYSVEMVTNSSSLLLSLHVSMLTPGVQRAR